MGDEELKKVSLIIQCSMITIKQGSKKRQYLNVGILYFRFTDIDSLQRVLFIQPPCRGSIWTCYILLVLSSVTRLADFLKFWVKYFVSQVAQTYSDFWAIKKNLFR